MLYKGDMRRIAAGLALLALCASAPGATQPEVKKSEQGICHARGSGAYKRTQHYESFDSMPLCLASGGRVAKNAEVDGEAGEPTHSSGTSWLGNIGGKIALIVGTLVIVGGAFLISRRRSP